MNSWNKIFVNIFIGTLILIATTVTAQTVKLKIIETSDVHGSIFPYDFKNDQPKNGSLAQVQSYLIAERARTDQHVILLDNGDILQGQPTVYYYNFEETGSPHLYAEVMNYMKYDAGTVGNHDIEAGHDVYDRFAGEINFPWLAANAVNTSTGKPYFKPYHIFNKGGVKVAVLGLITPHIPHWLPEKIWAGMRFDDMIETAKKWVKIINEKENPNVLIGLFHAGADYTYNNQSADQPYNENASQLVAEQVPGFDVVFVGHDHLQWNYTVKDPNGKEVLILGPTNAGVNVAVADIVFEYNMDNDTWTKSISGEVIDMEYFSPDKDFMNKFSTGYNYTKNYVSRKIGAISKTISTRESLFGDSPFVDLIHRIQLDLTDADISFAAPLSFNAKISEGDIFVSDMFNLYKYENLLYTMELTGKEILGYMEYSYSIWFNQMKDENDHLLNFAKNESGEIAYSKRTNSPMLKSSFYNYDSAAGIEYEVDVTKPAGEKVKIISMSNGEKFQPDKKYKVALNSYRGNGGGNHLTDGAKIDKDKLADRIITSTEKDLRYYLMKWIEAEKTINPSALGNWKVTPEDWWQKGKKLDYNILFEN